MTLPYYYSSLSPFREVFRTGMPLLAYHHVALPRRGARVKWLYLTPELFARQMTELREGGFSTPEFSTVLPPPSCPDEDEEGSALVAVTLAAGSKGQQGRTASSAVVRPPKMIAGRHEGNPGQRVYLTFDDGFSDVFDRALPLLLENRLRSINYLVSSLLGKSNEWQLKLGDVVEPLMDVVQVREWLEAGQEIGAHTQTHPHLTQLSLAAAREEITGSKKSLEDRFGVRVDHFSYPYGDCNKAVRDLVIEAGFKSACTISPGVNTSETSVFELKRLICRRNSRTLKTIWKRLCTRLGSMRGVFANGKS